MAWRGKTCSRRDARILGLSTRGFSLVLACLLAVAAPAFAAGFKPVVLPEGYEHDKWVTQPRDHAYQFAAYITSFDGADDNNGDGDQDSWGIPEWVAFEIKRTSNDFNSERPSRWITLSDLASQGLAPSDDTYAVSGVNDMREVKTDYRFVRGHMCPKNTAERISADAAYNTHTVLNACPQLQWQNNGIWKALEQDCHDWADKYERIWIICGPVFFGREPALWLGQDGETKAAVPDALFKIIVRQDGAGLVALAFLIPNILPKSEDDLDDFLTSIDRIEALTGLDFLTALDDDTEAAVEAATADDVDW